MDQVTEGSQYRDLKPAIVICVLNKSLLPQQSGLHSDFRLRDAAGQVLTDDLQVHLLELTKLTVQRDNLSTASALERWAYFFLNASSMTAEETRKILPDPEFVEAWEILEMIKQTPEHLHEYSERMKLRLDEAARIEYAREEGLKQGEARGALLGQIALLREFLGLEEPTPEELAGYDLSQLTTLAQRLRNRLRSRPQ